MKALHWFFLGGAMVLIFYGCSPSFTPADPDLTVDALQPFRSLHLLPLLGTFEKLSDQEFSNFEGTLNAFGATMTLEGIADRKVFKVFFFQFQDRVTIRGTWGTFQLVDGQGSLKNSELRLKFKDQGLEHYNAILKPGS